MICRRCSIDYKDLGEHQQGDTCAVNMAIRTRVMLQMERILVPADFCERLIREAGLEMWRVAHKNDPLGRMALYAPRWAVNICRATWLQGHRVWMLRRVARSPQLQKALDTGVLKKIDTILRKEIAKLVTKEV